MLCDGPDGYRWTESADLWSTGAVLLALFCWPIYLNRMNLPVLTPAQFTNAVGGLYAEEKANLNSPHMAEDWKQTFAKSILLHIAMFKQYPTWALTHTHPGAPGNVCVVSDARREFLASFGNNRSLFDRIWYAGPHNVRDLLEAFGNMDLVRALFKGIERLMDDTPSRRVADFSELNQLLRNLGRADLVLVSAPLISIVQSPEGPALPAWLNATAPGFWDVNTNLRQLIWNIWIRLRCVAPTTYAAAPTRAQQAALFFLASKLGRFSKEDLVIFDNIGVTPNNTFGAAREARTMAVALDFQFLTSRHLCSTAQ